MVSKPSTCISVPSTYIYLIHNMFVCFSAVASAVSMEGGGPKKKRRRSSLAPSRNKLELSPTIGQGKTRSCQTTFIAPETCLDK